MDFVHYQPPTERDSKAKSDKKTLHQKITRRRSPGGGVKLDSRGTHVSSQYSKSRSAGDVEEVETSTRPRLSPEQVWLLERQFQAHSKPSSELKRQLAEITSLSLPRVANWFQNRRAKAKHQKKQEEAELSLALEAAGQQFPGTPSPDATYLAGFSAAEISQATTQAPGPLATRSQISVRPPLFGSSSQASYASTIVPSTAAESASAQATFDGATGPSDSKMTVSDVNLLPYALYTEYKSHGPSVNSAQPRWGRGEDTSAMWASASQLDTHLALNGLFSQSNQNPSQGNHSVNHAVNKALASQFQSAPGQQLFERSVPAEAAQSQYLMQTSTPPQAMSGGVLPGQESFSSDILSSFNPVAIPSESQAGASLVDLAARRNRPRPAALGLAALRSHSFEGPPSGSPTGNALGSGSVSPVRRIRSAGNGLSPMGGRIQKTRPGSTQRSPLTRTTFVQAQASDNSHANSLEATSMVPPSSASTGNSFPPPTPMSPSEGGTLKSGGSGSAVLHDLGGLSGPQDVNLAFSMPLNLLTNPASPPATPNDTCLRGYQQNPGIYGSPSYFAPLCVDQKSVDEANFSPRSMSFSPQIHMPQPQYASPTDCGNPDMTSLLHGLEFYHPAHKIDEIGHGTSSHGYQALPEFRIHNASPQRQAKLSLSKQRSFVFTNQTPADF